MNKTVINISFYLMSFMTVSGQAMIEMPEYYKGCGVIFPQDYKLNFILKSMAGRFTPNKEMVEKAERIIQDDFYVYFPESTLKRKLLRFYRQYIGYFNKKGEQILMVRLLNFRNRRKAKEYFKGWDSNIIIGLGDFYDRNLIRYHINLDKGEMIF